jgi:hypothetical protein
MVVPDVYPDIVDCHLIAIFTYPIVPAPSPVYPHPNPRPPEAIPPINILLVLLGFVTLNTIKMVSVVGVPVYPVEYTEIGVVLNDNALLVAE